MSPIKELNHTVTWFAVGALLFSFVVTILGVLL